MSVKAKITELLKELNTGVYEKEEVIALSLLSSVAGESIFLLGSPGVAKSLVARKLKYAYKDGTSFEYLMNRFSTPDEIFGPVSISQLKDHDKYERIVKNYLPDAKVVFLDEIWKAGPSIQNALLTVLNEKIYRNGEKEINVPMKALISASNELPSKGEGLEALWDRFLIRLIVEGIKDKQLFNDMISKPLNSYNDTVKDILKITDEEYEQWSKEIDQVSIPENIFNVIHVIRNYIDLFNQQKENPVEPIYISDRRWRKIVRILRTSAFLNDRKEVDLMDCFLIKDCLWNELEQIPVVTQFVNDAIEKHGYKLGLNLKGLTNAIRDFEQEIEKETTAFEEKEVKELEVFDKAYYEIKNFGNATLYISIKEFQNLSQQNPVYVMLFSRQQNQYYQYQQYQLKKSQDSLAVVVNNIAYPLSQISKKEKQKIPKKLHPAVKREWDKKINEMMTLTTDIKTSLDTVLQTTLAHLDVNLFVNRLKADLVRKNVKESRKELDKAELELQKLQNHIAKNVKVEQDISSPESIVKKGIEVLLDKSEIDPTIKNVLKGLFNDDSLF